MKGSLRLKKGSLCRSINKDRKHFEKMAGERTADVTFVRQSNEHLFEECLSKQRLD